MDKLKCINEQMALIAVPYQFGEWAGAISYPYFVGELPSPSEFPTEDGREDSNMIVTGFHRGDILTLVEYAERIKTHFDPVFGFRAKTDSGSIAVFFNGFLIIPAGEADLKKIEIHLTIKEWKGAV